MATQTLVLPEHLYWMGG